MKALHLQRTLVWMPDRNGSCIHCGGPAVYSAESRWENGRRVLALCELHGRAFSIRWDIGLPEPVTAGK